ncbi:Retrovirus-related Pol polyprotein from type-1 retrotransposable element R2, partial [Araneus ventricosus]
FLLSALSPSEFGDTKPKRRGRTRRTIVTSKRKAKKREYARLQALYKRNRSNCFNSLFEKASLSPDLDDRDVFDFWSHLFTRSSPQNFKNDSPFILSDKDITEDLFVTPQEIYSARLPFSSSSGPDGASVKTLNKIPIRCRCKIYTAFLLLRWVPSFLLDSRTVFLPKKENTSKPSMLRPLSISSTMLRQFHKVLAKRLMAVLDPALDVYQFGFRQMDGIAEAVLLFGYMVQSACTNFSTIAVAVLDMEKAFDSVSHDAIFEALQKINISPVMKDYLKFTYTHAKTFLCFNGSIKSEPVRPTRGVRQGDPMSPLLFLLVFDQVLNAIPDYEGFHFENKRINHIAFADDLVLVADSMVGLNNIINRILPALTWSGLSISWRNR